MEDRMARISVVEKDWLHGARAAFDLVKVNGQTCVQKRYLNIIPNLKSGPNKRLVLRLKRERFARRIFAGYPWVSPLLSTGVSPHSLIMPLYKHRLGAIKGAKSGDVLPDADDGTRRTMAKQLLKAMYDMYAMGYAHCDLHPNNLFWEGGQVIITDFESMRSYPPGLTRPAFPESFDVADNPDSRLIFGTKRRWRRGHVVGYGGHMFGVPTTELLAEMEGDIRMSLERASRYWHTALKPGGRHLARRHGQPTVYTSIELPHTKIPGSRNSA
jgi:serine/threonine protein kinase